MVDVAEEGLGVAKFLATSAVGVATLREGAPPRRLNAAQTRPTIQARTTRGENKS